MSFGWPAGQIPSWVGEVAKFAPIAASAVTAAVLEPVPHHLHGAMLEFVYTAMDTLRGILIPAFVERDQEAVAAPMGVRDDSSAPHGAPRSDRLAGRSRVNYVLVNRALSHFTIHIHTVMFVIA